MKIHTCQVPKLEAEVSRTKTRGMTSRARNLNEVITTRAVVNQDSFILNIPWERKMILVYCPIGLPSISSLKNWKNWVFKNGLFCARSKRALDQILNLFLFIGGKYIPLRCSNSKLRIPGPKPEEWWAVRVPTLTTRVAARALVKK